MNKLIKQTERNFLVIYKGRMHVAEFPRSWKPKSGDRFRWKGESIEVIKVGLKSEECCLFIGFEENTDNYVAGLYMLTPPLSDLDGEVN